MPELLAAISRRPRPTTPIPHRSLSNPQVAKIFWTFLAQTVPYGRVLYSILARTDAAIHERATARTASTTWSRRCTSAVEARPGIRNGWSWSGVRSEPEGEPTTKRWRPVSCWSRPTAAGAVFHRREDDGASFRARLRASVAQRRPDRPRTAGGLRRGLDGFGMETRSSPPQRASPGCTAIRGADPDLDAAQGRNRNDRQLPAARRADAGLALRDAKIPDTACRF